MAATSSEQRVAALDRLISGDFRGGAAALETAASAAAPPDPVSQQAQLWIDEFLSRRTDDESDRQADFKAAAAMAQTLLVIADHDGGDKAVYTPIRTQLGEVREILVDLLAAPRVEDNVTGPNWYADWLTRDRSKIREVLIKVEAALPADDPQADQIRTGATRLTGALDAFVAEAAAHDWRTQADSERSLDDLADQTEPLAEAMDDLSALVSKYPWRMAVMRLRMAKEVAGEDLAFLDESWVTSIVAGAVGQAQRHETDGKWYDALALYGVLDRLYDEDGRYDKEIEYVTRRARAVSLYSDADDDDDADAEGPVKGKDKPLADPSVDKPPVTESWREYARGVDAYMVRQALVRIDETYVENVDYRKVLQGALRAVRVLAQSPELVATFEGLGDQGKRDEFIERIDDLLREAGTVDGMTYRMVGRCLNQVLWANRQTVRIPDEVIHVEFTDGMMKELDRFSTMIWPSEWPEFMKHTMGSFKGVGIQIQVQRETNMLMVVTPLENSPAFDAGIKAGDFIVKIDGKDAIGLDIEEAVRRITGPKDTNVELTIKRPGLEATFNKTLTRAEIHIQTVKGWKRLNGSGWDWMIDPTNRIGYIRLTSFNRDTARELGAALEQLQSQNVRGLILDLRGNPGGLLGAAVAVTNEFVSEGKIVSTKGRQQRTAGLAATADGRYLTGELIVLVDERSASAAEIVSGALKDLGRAVIVGQRSYGKGSVQNLIPIRQDPTGSNDAYLKVTTAYYYLPSDRCLHRIDGATEWGVEPDVKRTITPKQLRRWISLQRRTEIIKNRDLDQLEEDMARQSRADIQLDTALLVCRLRLLRDGAISTVAQTP